jgi:serine/threonine protein kinase
MANSGYVHLDVKPDNIVMGIPPRLIDLSIARTLERAARTAGPSAPIPTWRRSSAARPAAASVPPPTPGA